MVKQKEDEISTFFGVLSVNLEAINVTCIQGWIRIHFFQVLVLAVDFDIHH